MLPLPRPAGVQVTPHHSLTPTTVGARATFSISVARPHASLTVLSNMPVAREEGEVVVFQPTPALPSYLVCVVLGHYSAVTQRSGEGVTVSVYTPQVSSALEELSTMCLSGPDEPGRVCPGHRRQVAGLLLGVLLCVLQPAQAGPGGGAGLLHRRHGELGAAHFQGDCPALQAGLRHAEVPPVRLHPRHPRDCSPGTDGIMPVLLGCLPVVR